MEFQTMCERLAQIAEKQSRVTVAGIALLLFFSISVIDYQIDANVSLSIFYLVPVAFSTWFVGRNFGLVIAVLSVGARTMGQVGSTYLRSHEGIIEWNGFLHLSFMLVFVWLFSLLREHLKAEQALARTDAITGIPNRRAFMEQLQYVLELETRGEHPVTLAYIDLDDFKLINDLNGHEEGDKVLQLVASTLVKSIRRSDVAARLGGDEFALLIPGANRSKAEFLIGKIRTSLSEILVTHRIRVTCSIGCVTFRKPPIDPDTAIRAADFLMYRIKHHGKNEVAFEDF